MSAGPSRGPRCVLVVEDEILIRLLIVDWLEDAGFETLEAEDGEQAIYLLESHTEIGLLFTDINMPGKIDGLQLAAYAHDRWSQIDIIVGSSYPPPGEDEVPIGTDFLSKPYDEAKLIALFQSKL